MSHCEGGIRFFAENLGVGIRSFADNLGGYQIILDRKSKNLLPRPPVGFIERSLRVVFSMAGTRTTRTFFRGCVVEGAVPYDRNDCTESAEFFTCNTVCEGDLCNSGSGLPSGHTLPTTPPPWRPPRPRGQGNDLYTSCTIFIPNSVDLS